MISRRYLVILCLCVLCEELVLVTAYLTGTLSPRAFGVADAAVLLITWIIATLLLRKARRKDILAGSDKVRMSAKQRTRRIWEYRFGIVFMNLCLIGSLWQNKDLPLLLLLLGVAINLLITAAFIWALRGLQRDSS